MLDKTFMRRKSESVASAVGAVIPKSLPTLEDVTLFRSEREIVSRLLALNGLIATTVGFSKERAIQWMEAQGVGRSLVPAEDAFLRSGQGEPMQFQILVEAMRALAWSVQIVEDMDVFSPCSNTFVLAMPNLKEDEPVAQWFEKANLRPVEEIEQMLDILYCLHWAIREASLGGVKLRRTLESSVVIERRRALEWVTHEEEWGEIELDT